MQLSVTGHHVDESRRDGHPRGVDGCLRLRGAEIADLGDAVATDADIGPGRGPAASVIDRSAFHHDIERA